MNVVDKIMQQIWELRGTRDYNAALTELMNLIYRESGNRTVYFEIVNRIIARADPDMNFEVGTENFDLIALFAPEVQNMFVGLQVFEDQTFPMTATGAELDRWGASFSLPRQQAKRAIMRAIPLDRHGNPMPVPIGSRFMSVDTSETLEYVSMGMSGDITLLQCQTEGIIGSSYMGFLIATPSVNNLASIEIIGTENIGQDREPDNMYRERLRVHLARVKSGGNIWEYKYDFVIPIDGIGDCIIFPAWLGGGTVKVCILDSSGNPVPAEFLDTIKAVLDPVFGQGGGIGKVPVGHRVAVSTPEFVDIDIVIDAELRSNFIVAQARPIIENAVYEYIETQKRLFPAMWQQRLDSGEMISYETAPPPGLPFNPNMPPLDVRFSLVVSWVNLLSEIMNTDVVLRVMGLTMNGLSGLAQDLILESDKYVQKLPRIASITINEV